MLLVGLSGPLPGQVDSLAGGVSGPLPVLQLNLIVTNWATNLQILRLNIIVTNRATNLVTPCVSVGKTLLSITYARHVREMGCLD